VIGVRAIRSTFESIFANGAIPVIAEGKRSVQTLDSAVHSVVERITITSPEGLRTGFAVATNVYVKTAQGWRMVAHHATPGASEAPAEISEPPTVLH
jgi:ketosteroid isomerase-like protein